MLKKHEDFLNDNPEVFHAIEDRLFKAIDYEDYEGEDDQDLYDDEEDFGGEGYGDDLFDRVPSEDESEIEDFETEENDEAAKWLREQEGSQATDDSNTPEVGNVQQEKKVEDKPAKRSSRYRDWEPRGNYEDKHNDAISKYMDEGYSHREAERLAGAHESPTDFYSALKHTINPSEPSPKMLEHMKELAHGWLKHANRKADEAASAELNPIKYATGRSIAAHEEVHGDFSEAYNNFLNSDDMKGLKGKARHDAIKSFKKQWHDDNPEHREKAIAAAGAGQHFKEASEARAKRREEGKAAILSAGQAPGEMAGGYSQEAAGIGEQMSDQAAAQAVGGVKGEHGYQANIKKDPAAVFAERNPEYVKNLRDKLKNKLDEGQSQRMSAVDSFKKKGSE